MENGNFFKKKRNGESLFSSIFYLYAFFIVSFLKAKGARDAMAKTMYNSMFDWLFLRINTCLTTTGMMDIDESIEKNIWAGSTFIGILVCLVN